MSDDISHDEAVPDMPGTFATNENGKTETESDGALNQEDSPHTEPEIPDQPHATTPDEILSGKVLSGTLMTPGETPVRRLEIEEGITIFDLREEGYTGEWKILTDTGSGMERIAFDLGDEEVGVSPSESGDEEGADMAERLGQLAEKLDNNQNQNPTRLKQKLNRLQGDLEGVEQELHRERKQKREAVRDKQEAELEMEAAKHELERVRKQKRRATRRAENAEDEADRLHDKVHDLREKARSLRSASSSEEDNEEGGFIQTVIEELFGEDGFLKDSEMLSQILARYSQQQVAQQPTQIQRQRQGQMGQAQGGMARQQQAARQPQAAAPGAAPAQGQVQQRQQPNQQQQQITRDEAVNDIFEYISQVSEATLVGNYSDQEVQEAARRVERKIEWIRTQGAGIQIGEWAVLFADLASTVEEHGTPEEFVERLWPILKLFEDRLQSVLGMFSPEMAASTLADMYNQNYEGEITDAQVDIISEIIALINEQIADAGQPNSNAEQGQEGEQSASLPPGM